MSYEETPNPFTEVKKVMADAELNFELTARKVTHLGLGAPEMGQSLTPTQLLDQEYEAYLNIRESLTELSSELIGTGKEINEIFDFEDGVLPRAMDFVTSFDNVTEIQNRQRLHGDSVGVGVIIGAIMQEQGLQEKNPTDFQIMFNCASALYEDGLAAQLHALREDDDGIEPEVEEDGDLPDDDED